MTMAAADLVLHRGLIATLDRANPKASAAAMSGGVVAAAGCAPAVGGARSAALLSIARLLQSGGPR
jgi:predicted amidohydrolase YtcJ